MYGIVAAAILVAVTRGSFERLTSIKLTAWWAMAASFVIQTALEFDVITAARYDDLGLGLLLVSYALLLAFCVANLRYRGMGIILVGIGANALVIALNGGMPVDMSRSGGCDVTPLPNGCIASVKHQPATSADVLPILGDFIPVPGDLLISYGDLILVSGIMDLCFWASRTKRRSQRERSEAEHDLAAAEHAALASGDRRFRLPTREQRVDPSHWAATPGTEDSWLAQVTGRYDVVPKDISSEDPWASLRDGPDSAEVASVARLVAKANEDATPVQATSGEHATGERIPLWRAPSTPSVEPENEIESSPAVTLADPTSELDLTGEHEALHPELAVPALSPVEPAGAAPSLAQMMAEVEAKLANAEAELARTREAITSWHPAVAS